GILLHLSKGKRCSFQGFGVVWQAIILLFAFNVAQLLWVENGWQHFYFSIKILLFGMLAVQLSLQKKERGWVGVVFSLQLIALLTLSTLQIITKRSIGGVWCWLGERSFSSLTPGIALQSLLGGLYLRPYATFSHPNVLAGYAVLVVLWNYLFFVPRTPVQRKIKIVGLVVGIITILISWSQGVWLSLVGVFIVGKLLSKWPDLKSYSLFAGVIICLTIPFLLVVGERMVGNLFLSEEIVVRNRLFQNFIQHLPNALIGGYGWHGTWQQSRLGAAALLGYRGLQPVHNAAWYIISSIGVVGVTILALISYKIIKKLSFYQVLIILLIIFLSTVDHYPITQQQTLLLAILLLGLSAVSGKTVR
ncbi:MAG: hypothetical protein ACOX6V_05805, partial [Patescibacteria group bacterium]